MSQIGALDILERARGSLRMGDFEKAEQQLKAYLAQHGKDRNTRLLLGITLARAGKLDAAMKEFKTLLAEDNRDAEVLNNIAVIYRKQEKYAEAEKVLKGAIGIEPDKAEFYYNLGNIYKQTGKLKAANSAYTKVIELNPRYVSAYNNLGTIYDRQGELARAIKVFKKGLSLDRNNPTLHFNLGVALESSGALEDAEKEYSRALKSKPGWIEAMNNLGIVQFKLGQHSKGLDVFSHILAIDPFNTEARNNMGIVLADQGKYEEAIRYYRGALEANPTYARGLVNLEHALEKSGDLAGASVELEKLIDLIPENSECKVRLASLYLKQERYPEALKQATEALRESETIRALRIQGSANCALGKIREAKACFNRILEIDPDDLMFHMDLADIYHRKKEYTEAEKHVQTYLHHKGDDRNAKYMLGKLYMEMPNTLKAIEVFAALHQSDPHDAEALAALAELYKTEGNIEKALQTADRLVNLQGGRASAEDLSDLNKSLEFYESAVSAYSDSIQEMWEQNLQQLKEASAEEPEDVDPLLLGAEEIVTAVDEEEEPLFIEDTEIIDDNPVEESEEFPMNDQGAIPDEIPEKDPFDALIEDEEEYTPKGAQEKSSPEALPPVQELGTRIPEQLGRDTGLPADAPGMQAYPSGPVYIQIPGTPIPASGEDEAKPQSIQYPPMIHPTEKSSQEESEPLEAELDEESTGLEEDQAAPPPMEVRNTRVKLDEHKLEDASDVEGEKNPTLDLFRYLKDLSEELPENERDEFRRSEIRLRMEFVMDRLSGRRGLLKELAEKGVGSSDIVRPVKAATKETITETLSYLGNLAGALPDQELTKAIERKVETVIKGLNQKKIHTGDSRE